MRLGLVLFGFAIVAGSVAGKATIYSAVVGERPPPRPLSDDKRQFYEELFKAGVVKEVPTHAPNDRPVKLRKLSDSDVAKLTAEVGGSLESLLPVTGTVSQSSPKYPPRLMRSGKDARVVCYFEVLPDGSVGRIYGGEVSSEDFFIECARALRDWRFVESPSPRFLRLPFEAKFKGYETQPAEP